MSFKTTDTATDCFKHRRECKTEWICPATAFFNVVLPLKFLGMTFQLGPDPGNQLQIGDFPEQGLLSL